MACNGYNHAADCDCGWGGVNYNSGYSTLSTSYSFSSVIVPASYVNPNARCPVCGENVFFYQSPNGGRVFFDELGPPWTKHGCTDNPQVPNEKILKLSVDNDTPHQKPAWVLDGWHPFFLSKNWKGELELRIRDGWCVFKGSTAFDQKFRYIALQIFGDDEAIKNARFMFIRKKTSREGVYEVSIWADDNAISRVGFANVTFNLIF